MVVPISRRTVKAAQHGQHRRVTGQDRERRARGQRGGVAGDARGARCSGRLWPPQPPPPPPPPPPPFGPRGGDRGACGTTGSAPHLVAPMAPRQLARPGPWSWSTTARGWARSASETSAVITNTGGPRRPARARRAASARPRGRARWRARPGTRVFRVAEQRGRPVPSLPHALGVAGARRCAAPPSPTSSSTCSTRWPGIRAGRAAIRSAVRPDRPGWNTSGPVSAPMCRSGSPSSRYGRPLMVARPGRSARPGRAAAGWWSISGSVRAEEPGDRRAARRR